MKIQKYIQNQIFLPRIRKNSVLVVYDPETIYQDVCLDMATDTIPVIDASNSSITSREKALKASKNLGRLNTDLEGLLVYVPAKAPETEEDKQKDPFALYAVCGSVFPDGAGDAFMHILNKRSKIGAILMFSAMFSGSKKWGRGKMGVEIPPMRRLPAS